jgi:hypothetical protein
MANTPSTKKLVVYTGTSTIREIDANSWKSVGVADQGKVVWEQSKGHEVPAEELNADAIRFLTERTGGEFVVREVPAD